MPPAIGSRHVATERADLRRRARNAEFLDAAAECTGIEAEDRGRAARARDDPVGVAEDVRDVVAFDCLHALKRWGFRFLSCWPDYWVVLLRWYFDGPRL